MRTRALAKSNAALGRRRWLPAIVGAPLALLLAGVVGLSGYELFATSSPAGPEDLAGNAVHLEGREPDPKLQSAESDIGVRFNVPAVGLNVPLGALNIVNDTITPPGFTSAYWVRNHGAAYDHPDAGTVFVVMHSLRNGGVGPGNFLIDVNSRASRLRAGDLIEVGRTTYVVTATNTVAKSNIGGQKEVWANEPDRLVVITCLQRAEGGPSHENVVIEAKLVRG